MFFLQDTSCLSSQEKNVITDGQFTCPYSKILGVFEYIRSLFEERKIDITDCVALECDNSVLNVLVLLFLLENGYRFLLLSKGVQSAQSMMSVPPSIPSFCRYRIRVESLNDNGKGSGLEHLDRILLISANEQWVDCEAARGILYLQTSGSTGVPKIVVHSHAKLRENALNCVQRFGLSYEDRVTIPVPIYHMYGLGAALLPSLAVGASIDLQKGTNLLRYLQREREFESNVAFVTPAFCETLAKGRKSPRLYKLTVAAGDRIREDTFSRYEAKCGCLVKLYGSTEMGAIAAGSPDEAMEIRLQQVGLPMSGVQIRVEPSATVSPNPLLDYSQKMGELWCYHPAGFNGYVDRAGLPIQSHPDFQEYWFRTKDLGQLEPDGRLTVLGRCDRSVNRDGLLVPFCEVEQAIETLAGIESVIVEAQGESPRGKGLVAYCVLTQETTLSEVEIRNICFNILPKYAIPDRVVILNAFPLLQNGKVDRQKLISMTAADAMNLARG